MVEGGALPASGVMAGLAFFTLLAFVHVVFPVAGQAGRRGIFVFLVLVAIVAFHLAVLARQRESRLVVVELVILPVAFAMTVAAQLTQGAFVLVNFFMAGDTRHGSLFEDHALVASLALDVFVLATQGKTRRAVIETRLVPVALDVTLGAVGAEGVFVLVVFFVAGNAGGLQIVAIQVPGVTTIAPGLAMLAAQDISGIRIVIEPDSAPGLGVVAGLALFAIAPLVLVVLAMARPAGHRRVLEGVVLVAILAFGLGMFVFEPEVGLVVIKLRFLPVGFRVAVRALRAQLALVFIILLVTGDTGRLRTSVLASGAVALTALRIGVFPFEQVIRLPMVEFLLVQHDHFRVPALVLGMAFPARLSFPGAAVKALFLRNIARHVLVAIPTQGVLPGTVKTEVTLVALPFRLGMSLDDLAWHQDAFKRSRPATLAWHPTGQNQ